MVMDVPKALFHQLDSENQGCNCSCYIDITGYYISFIIVGSGWRRVLPSIGDKRHVVKKRKVLIFLHIGFRPKILLAVFIGWHTIIYLIVGTSEFVKVPIMGTSNMGTL